MSWIIRPARIEDLGDLLGLTYQLSKKTKEDEQITKDTFERSLTAILEDKTNLLVVYESENKVVGTATLLLQLNLSHGARPYGHIENVVTDSAYRGKGVGKALITYLLDEARKRNCYKVILDCSKANIPFYEKCGLAPTGEVEMRINL
jgi:glucosamine-phosphate N-acetyltransferase